MRTTVVSVKSVPNRFGLGVGLISIAIALLVIIFIGFSDKTDTQSELSAISGLKVESKPASQVLSPIAGQEKPSAEPLAQAPSISNPLTKDTVISVFTPAGQLVLRKKFGEMISTAEMAPHQFSIEAVRCVPQSCSIKLRAPATFGASKNNAAIADLLALASDSAGVLGGTFGISSISHLSEGTEVQLALTRNGDQQLVTLTQEQIAKLRLETLQKYINESKEPPPK